MAKNLDEALAEFIEALKVKLTPPEATECDDEKVPAFLGRLEELHKTHKADPDVHAAIHDAKDLAFALLPLMGFAEVTANLKPEEVKEQATVLVSTAKVTVGKFNQGVAVLGTLGFGEKAGNTAESEQ